MKKKIKTLERRSKMGFFTGLLAWIMLIIVCIMLGVIVMLPYMIVSYFTNK